MEDRSTSAVLPSRVDVDKNLCVAVAELRKVQRQLDYARERATRAATHMPLHRPELHRDAECEVSPFHRLEVYLEEAVRDLGHAVDAAFELLERETWGSAPAA